MTPATTVPGVTEAVIHPAGGPAGSRLDDLLGAGPQLMAGFAPLVGPLDPPPIRLSGPATLLAEAGRGLPEGPAKPEAVAVRLRHAGVPLRLGEPVELSPRELLTWSGDRGRHSVAVLRADPGLLCELQAGGWFNATATARVARRALRRAGPRVAAAGLGTGLTPRRVRMHCDAAFWSGVADVAGASEWRRLTRGYTALIYHRLAGEMKPGQESLDLPPAQFRRQMRALRLLGFRPLSVASVVALHAAGEPPPRRAIVVTADDAFADCVAELGRHGALRPALFVPTRVVGGRAVWAGSEPVADWDRLDALRAAGVDLGAHTRHHVRLTEASDAILDAEVSGSLADLADRGAAAPLAFAYPHGAHDRRVRAAVRDAGAAVAFTTEIGRNGAGTDPWCLRRIGIKEWDTLPAFVFKAVTGEHLPGPWDRRLRSGARSRRPTGPDAA